MLTAPRPDFLATADERLDGRALGRARRARSPARQRQRPTRCDERIARLQGVLTFQLRTEYHERLDEVHAPPARARRQPSMCSTRSYDAFVRARQAAAHSYEGYDTPIARLRDARRQTRSQR